MLDDILVALLTKHHIIKAQRAQTKIGNDAIGYRRKLPSVEITLPRDIPKGNLLTNLKCPVYNQGSVQVKSCWLDVRVAR